MFRLSRLSIASERNDFSTGLLFYCVCYTAAAASEYWLLNWLKYLYDIKLAIFCAMLQNASWPIQGVIYYFERKEFEKSGPRIITHAMYRSYAILGGLNAVITLTRTIGLVTLPPTIYVIAANTEIVFEALMTRVFLRRTLTRLQRISVLFVLLGVFIALYDPKHKEYGKNQNVSQLALLSGLAISLLSRLFSALNTVLADK